MKKAIKNYLAKLQENDKKGFSLVELIIVMAIMAILVGIVASQVLPYMEKSRQSKDQQILSNICTDVVSSIAQAEKSVGDFDETVIALSDGTTTDTNAKLVSPTFKELHGVVTQADLEDSLKSKEAKDNSYAVKVKYEVDSTTNKGTVTVYVDGSTSTKMKVTSD
jgi:type IV pilus assembly protein PilA